MDIVLILYKKGDSEPDVMTCICPEIAAEILKTETDFITFLRKLLKAEEVPNVDCWSDLSVLVYSTTNYTIRTIGWERKISGLIGYLTYQ